MKAKSLFLIVFAGLCWGPSFLFIKIALPEMPPFTISMARSAFGFLLILSLCLFQKHRLGEFKRHWKDFAILGVTLNMLPSVLICYSELYIASSLAGILNSLTLIFTAILSYFFYQERLTKNKLAGIALGLAGLFSIYLPLLIHEKSLGSQLGIFLMVLSTISYAIGTLYARKHLEKTPGLVALAFQLLIATLVLLPLSLLIDRPSLPSLPAFSASLGLGFIGTGLGFFIYYKAIELAGATYASFATLIIPIAAILLGVLFLHETLTWNVYLGAALILGGIIGVNPALKKSPL